MKFLKSILIFIFVILYDTLEFSIRGSGPLVVPLGGSVLLPCSVDSLLSLERVKVEWRKTDSEVVVHLYQDGDIRPEVQNEDYHDRAHFFTDDIKHGNFSLMLTNVTQEDKGVYRCKVYSESGSAEKTLVEIKDVEYLIVLGSDHSVYVGEDVTLNCSVDSHVPPEDIEEVSWKKRDKDKHIKVLLYQNNKTLSESSDERYRDRVEFFTDEIHRGNFSLRLKRVSTKDRGVYMCQVFAGPLSANTTVILEQLGLSGLHIIVLILCISACGSALLFCSLIYCRSNNTGKRPLLQACLYFCPNILILLAFVLWGTTEASLYETISCCVVCVLRPLRLLWFTPYIDGFPGVIIRTIKSSHADLYFPAVLVTMYSALLAEHFRDINTVSMMVISSLLVLVCLLFIIQLAKRVEKLLLVAACFFVLPSTQLGLLLYHLVAYWTVFFAAALAVLACLSLLYWCCKSASRAQQYFSLYLDKAVWTLMIVLSVILVCVYIAVLRNEKKDYIGLFCMGGFLQVLWMLIFSEIPVNFSKHWIRSIMFLFGSVGLILVYSVALMMEVILVAVNGERLMGDLRFIVFPSEVLFTIPLLILPIFTHWTPVNTTSQQGSQNSVESDGTHTTKLPILDQNQTGESHEMKTLSKDPGNSVERDKIT